MSRNWKASVCLLFAIAWRIVDLEAQVPFQNPVKQALKEGRPVIGATITATSPDIAATLASSGFDFLWIEMEHSPLTLETVRSMILATRGMKAMPFTRVPVNEPWLAKRVLDAGSLGVVFPFTSTRELAEQAVKACKYPPQGIRGFGPSLASPRWDFVGQSYAQFANDNVMVIPIIEQKQAVDNIEAIASVPGIDVMFIGASDLSYSLGVGGQRDHPLMLEAIAKVLAAGKKFGVPVGYPSGNPDEISKLIAQGFLFFQASTDLGMMKSAATEMLGKVQGRKTMPTKPAGSIYADK
jgi:2-keto-3-deoxy-L-rhamnonate aldolase RhmA